MTHAANSRPSTSLRTRFQQNTSKPTLKLLKNSLFCPPYECVLAAAVASLYGWFHLQLSHTSPLPGLVNVFFITTCVYLIDSTDRDNQTQGRLSLHLGALSAGCLGGCVAFPRVPQFGLLQGALLLSFTESYMGKASGRTTSLFKRSGLKASAIGGAFVLLLNAHLFLFDPQLFSQFKSAQWFGAWIQANCFLFLLIFLNSHLGDIRDQIEDAKSSVSTLAVSLGRSWGFQLFAFPSLFLSCALFNPKNALSIEMSPAFLWITATYFILQHQKKPNAAAYNIADAALFLPLLTRTVLH